MSLGTAVRPAPARERAHPRGAAPGRRRAGMAWLFAAPFLFLFIAMYAGPVLAGLGMSFTDLRSTDVLHPFSVNVVGFDQFAKVFADPVMRQAGLNTALFVAGTLPLTLGLALAAAIALSSGVGRLATFYRLGYYLPNVTSIVAIAVTWRFVLDPDAGLVNTLLATAGVDGPAWLADERTVLPSLMVMTAWRSFGFDMVILLAALRGIPRELYEAAQTDGAGPWQRFRSVTLPLLRPPLLFCTVYSSIGFMQFLEEPLVMTKGGPDNASLSASLAIYQQFGSGNYAYAGAAATTLFTVIVALSFFQFRLMKARHYS